MVIRALLGAIDYNIINAIPIIIQDRIMFLLFKY